MVPKSVIAATGTGTTRFRRAIVPNSSLQLDSVTYTWLHMHCIRAPREVLSAVSFASLRHNLPSVAHLNYDH